MSQEQEVSPTDVLDTVVYLAVVAGALLLALRVIRRVFGGR